MDKFVIRKRKRCHSPDDPQSSEESKVNRLHEGHSQITNQTTSSKPPVATTESDASKKLLKCVEGKDPMHVPCTSSSKESNTVEEDLHINHIHPVKWKKTKADNLDVDYCKFFDRALSRKLYELCERELEYNTGKIAQVHIFGKWIDIPRKQVAFGDAGLSYTFSNNTVPALPWKPFLSNLRRCISEATGYNFNFVLINRYKDGSDYMGEHKDDEKDLDPTAPIASLTLGQPRDFYFKHQDTKRKTRKVDNVNFVLEDGSLLLMNPPTNDFWYHALPKRLKVHGVRINLTFRVMKKK